MLKQGLLSLNNHMYVTVCFNRHLTQSRMDWEGTLSKELSGLGWVVGVPVRDFHVFVN